jgi:threonylcarbamoyladenosine tRNA methylthiotransferase MtaB
MLERVKALRSSIVELAIGCDVIVGFPGESDSDFCTTVRLLEQMPIAYLHVFRFSPRARTAAAALSDQVSEQTKRRRSTELARLGRAKRLEFNRRFAGAVLPAVVLNGRHGNSGRLRLLTDNYIALAAAGPSELMGRAVHVRVDAGVGVAATGKIL